MVGVGALVEAGGAFVDAGAVVETGEAAVCFSLCRISRMIWKGSRPCEGEGQLLILHIACSTFLALQRDGKLCSSSCRVSWNI